MQETIHVYSSGGVGDALIIALKIEKLKNYHILQDTDTIFYWDHAEKHECHRIPISNIMESVVGRDFFKCHIQANNPEAYIKELCKLNNGIYLNTRIMGIITPYLVSEFGSTFILPWQDNKLPHIVINVLAGRTYDNTRREIGSEIIHQIARQFPDRQIVLIGPESNDSLDKIDYEGRVYNATGKTPTVIDAMSYINGCCLFVGQDGVLAYYSMMLRKPTIIHYHIPNLIGHYFNQEWAYHSIALFGDSNRLNKLDENNNEIKALLEIAKKYGQMDSETSK